MLNHKQMLDDIHKLVETRFMADMELKLMPYRKVPDTFTQKEARKMAGILSSVWFITHSLECSGCGLKYKEMNK